MAEKKIINGRIVLKHDVESNWELATGFTPMAGEIIIYDVDDNYNYERIKIGDGSKNVNALPFVDDALRTELVAQIGAVDGKIDAISVLVGDTKVSDQIETAIANNIYMSDWNENDATNPAYIKNRPFYTESVYATLVEEQPVKISWVGEYGQLANDMPAGFVEGQTYFVTFNGVEYECVAWRANEEECCIGNGSIYGGEGKGGDEPFAFSAYDNGVCYLNVPGTGTYTVSVSGYADNVHKIDSKYLPEIDIIGARGEGDFAEIFNDLENNVATGKCSHAEGASTSASGYASHAEGYRTKAIERHSHAEGHQTEAHGEYSHAEGHSSKAYGTYSHAEGGSTIAYGEGSHAEGVCTVAHGGCQHVQGYSNIEDVDGIYLHIVGNGPTSIDKSNAHTIDWSGNAWFAGDVYVGSNGGVNKDAGSKKLATEAYVSELFSGIEIPDSNVHIETHNTSETAHSDIRALISTLSGLVGNTAVSAQISKAIEGKANIAKITSITLPASNWTGNTNPWSQVVTVNGVIANSKVDLQPTAVQVVELQNNDIALIAENDDGVVTVYALGNKPTVNYTMQALVTEVVVV